MYRRIAQFHKVSFNQFKKDFINTLGIEFLDGVEFIDNVIKEIYDDIKLPKRGTAESAGYDFFSPVKLHLEKNEIITLPTGIRVEIDPDWVLTCYPRSGQGFKNGLFLLNTVGVIDADYFYSDNEGHIMLKIRNRDIKDFDVEKGQGIMQGIFLPYGITIDDDATGERNGGFGSTDKK